jgi:glycine/D-amino acid oxidase-like deaminating enzyme
MKYDIVIVGGGIIGSSIAYFLARGGRTVSIAVIEPDPSYGQAATPQGAGGVRRLFSLPENIRMSQFSLKFFENFSKTMAVDDFYPEISFQKQGYLFLVQRSGVKQLETNYRLQLSEGVRVEMLDNSALRNRFPSITGKKIALACFSPDDGWIDPYSALQGFRRKAVSMGVNYIESRVIGFDKTNNCLTSVRLEQGDMVFADIIVNAAGAWAGEVAALAGVKLPLIPYCRLQHYWLCRANMEPLPLVKDDTGLFFRPEGSGFVGGLPSWEINPDFYFRWPKGRFKEFSNEYFETTVWPLVARLVPKFEAVSCERTWAGHYAQNLLDGNMILGSCNEKAYNLYLACGFSGHGIMHAPAVGAAMSELILNGKYSSIDLTRMSYKRVVENEPYRERGII